MKTLITGGTGLVGSTIKADIKLSSKDADLRDWYETTTVFEKNKPTHVVHTAAKVGGLGGNMRGNATYFLDNIKINTNVLEACRTFQVKKLVSILSTCIFPDQVEYPLTEDKIHQGPPHSSNYGYAYAKRMLDVQSRAYREQFDVNFVNVIPTNVYGPRDNFNIDDGHVLPSLIHKCYIAKKNNTDLEIWGSGKPLREFMYSEDLGKLINWVLSNYDNAEPIILSTSQEVSIKNIVDIICDAFNFKGNIIYNTDKPEGQFRKPSDNSKLMSLVPDFEFTPIEKGIKQTVNWFIENYDVARK